MTFIYTRCPFPDYCPLVSKNFAQIYAATRSNPALYSKLRLLSVSFDPAHDTPKVLRAIRRRPFKQPPAASRSTAGNSPPRRRRNWRRSPTFSAFSTTPASKEIVHSMSTSVIAPEGTIYKWYDDNDWKPADLVADATQALSHA